MTHLIDNGKLMLYGPVGLSFGDGEGFTAMQVQQALSEMDGDITVKLNSGGGLAFDGVAIHNALKDHDGKVTILVDGIAASAASVLAMAGDEIIMQDGALMMIHNASGVTWGTKQDHEKTINVLGRLDGSTGKIYARRSGQDQEAVQTMMDDETWMTGEEAVEAGFATSEAESKADDPTSFAYDLYQNAPDWLSNKYGISASQSETISREISTRMGQEQAAETVVENRKPRKDTPVKTPAKKPVADDVTAVQDTTQDNTQAIADAVQAERDRILGIEKLALPGHDAIVDEMKADGTTTPEQAAIRILQAEQAAGATRIQALQDADAEVDLDSAPTATGDDVSTSTPNPDRTPEEIWDQDEKVRQEFREKSAFLAFHAAEKKGQIKILDQTGKSKKK